MGISGIRKNVLKAPPQLVAADSQVVERALVAWVELFRRRSSSARSWKRPNPLSNSLSWWSKAHP